MPKQPSSKRPTLRDVAKYCQLSLATVSRVLANSDYAVSQQTREQVLQAAKVLHYTPNALGRSLKTQNTRKIGVVIPNITNPCYTQLLLGIGDRAMAAGYSVLMCSSSRSAAMEAKGLEMLVSECVAGILLAGIGSDLQPVTHAMNMGIPVVTIEQALPYGAATGCCHIGFDYTLGAKMAVEYLYNLGHRRIAFLGAPPVYHSRIEMLAGYRAAIAQMQLPACPQLEWLGIAETDTMQLYELENGEACARALMQLSKPPTACLCINDQSAIGLIRGLRKMGLRVPQDMSVIGFDNIPQGALTTPALTTIDQQAYQMGVLAFDALCQQIQNPDTPASSVMLSPQLIERESVTAFVP